MKTKIILLLRSLVSISLLIFLFTRIEWSQVPAQIQAANIMYVLLALFATQLAIVISAIKWYLLCKQTSDLTFFDSLRWYYVGFFFNNFLPGSIGGDLTRVYYASKKMDIAPAIASVTVERVFAGLALILTALVGFIGARGLLEYSIQIWMLAFVFGLLYFILFNKRIGYFFIKKFGKSVSGFYESINVYRSRKSVLFKLLLWSVAFQVCFVWITDLLFRSLGLQVNFFYQLAFVALISAITMLPVSINGLGVREGTYVYFFAMIGVAEVTSLTVSLLFYISVLLCTSIGGIFWAIETKKHKLTINHNQESAL